MPPRNAPLPAATTASARAARSAFFCDLCQKGYSRMNEFEAHESSYDHQHKKRLKEMKEMQQQVKSATARKEEKGGPLMTIKLGGAGKKDDGGTGKLGGGFKKGGFKNAFAPVGDVVEMVKKEDAEMEGAKDRVSAEEVDSDVTDEESDYDPRKPTGCAPGCPGWVESG